MNQQFKMLVTYRVDTFADNIYDAKRILTTASNQFAPATDKGKTLECIIIGTHFEAIDEPFNEDKMFTDVDAAYEYCSHYSNPIQCMLHVVQHQLDVGAYSFASQLLARL